jgi:hypothetical protein
MRRKRRLPISESEFREFKQTMARAKADERQQATPGPVIYHDALLRASVVVEHGGLWLVPSVPDGWQRRVALTMTPEARAERLRPAKDVTPAWLGIGGERPDGTTQQIDRSQQTETPTG